MSYNGRRETIRIATGIHHDLYQRTWAHDAQNVYYMVVNKGSRRGWRAVWNNRDRGHELLAEADRIVAARLSQSSRKGAA